MGDGRDWGFGNVRRGTRGGVIEDMRKGGENQRRSFLK